MQSTQVQRSIKTVHAALAGINPRGIQSVRADVDMPTIKTLIDGIHAAFASYKEHSEAEIAELRGGIDKMAIQMAGREMNGGADDAAAQQEQQPVHASTGLRGSQIGAFYSKRAQASAAGALDPRNNFGIADFIRGAAGMSVGDGVRAALSEGVGKDGGYAVPDVVMPRILGAMVRSSALLAAGASILPLDAAKSVSIAAVDKLPEPAWRNENAPVAIGGPAFRAVTATPRSIAIAVPISRELLADAVDMNRAVTLALAMAFSKAFDRAALVGSGNVPEPLGLHGMDGVKKIQQIGAKFSYADMLAAYQAQTEADAPAPTSIIMAPRTLVGLAGLVDSTGQPLNAPALLDGVARRTSVGVPTNLGDSANKSLAFIGNFNTVQFVLRENFNVRLLQETASSNGQLVFLCHARFDVVAQYPDAITVIEGVTS
ncbi:phage major capsid protein [Burkholderia dolosa]|uniref:phage major capsid protein n=1 Tax=Burkholderia dolosa TaxID=152500 RepID=UPI0027D29E05|nr:phage major capsid protein [Burkholderia dolosa]